MGKSRDLFKKYKIFKDNQVRHRRKRGLILHEGNTSVLSRKIQYGAMRAKNSFGENSRNDLIFWKRIRYFCGYILLS